MEKFKKVEEQNIDAELEYEIHQAHQEHKASKEAANGGGGAAPAM
jgi:flagellar motor component MotA